MSTISFGALTVAAAILLPTFYVIAAALPGVAALIAVPFLRGRQLTAMLVFVWTVGGAAATVGLALHLPADADAVGVALTGVTLAVVALFSALSLFRLSARFRADRDVRSRRRRSTVRSSTGRRSPPSRTRRMTSGSSP